jgi:hypothetical protein
MLLACYIVCFTVLTTPTVAAQPISQDSATLNELTDTLSRNFTTNDTKLGAVDMSIHQVCENPDVKKAEVISRDIPRGPSYTIHRAPKIEHIAQVVLVNNKVRYHLTALHHETNVGRVYGFDGGTWTELFTDRQVANIRRTDQLAGQLPMDPRHLLTMDARSTVHDFLRSASVRKAGKPEIKYVESNEHIALVSTTQSGNILLIFDPLVDFLPVRSVVLYADASVNWRTDVSYRKIPSRNAWLVDTVTSKYFPKGVATQPTSPGWTQLITTTVQDIRLLDLEAGEVAVHVSLPPGTRVHDLTRPKKDSSLSSASSAGIGTLFIALNAVLVLLLAILWAFLRRSRRALS